MLAAQLQDQIMLYHSISPIHNYSKIVIIEDQPALTRYQTPVSSDHVQQ